MKQIEKNVIVVISTYNGEKNITRQLESILQQTGVNVRNLVCRCWPEIDNLPHDLWVGLICYWFGKIYYVDEELYYWIRYQTSVTGAGTKWSGMRYRVKESLQGKSYPNVSQYLLSEYEDLLTKKDRVFLEMLSSYKRNIITRLKLIFDKDFRRDTLKGTAILKTGVLLGWL